jgi:hypothetical protein
MTNEYINILSLGDPTPLQVWLCYFEDRCKTIPNEYILKVNRLVKTQGQLQRWSTACYWWKEHNYNPLNIDGLLDRYTKIG